MNMNIDISHCCYYGLVYVAEMCIKDFKLTYHDFKPNVLFSMFLNVLLRYVFILSSYGLY